MRPNWMIHNRCNWRAKCSQTGFNYWPTVWPSVSSLNSLCLSSFSVKCLVGLLSVKEVVHVKHLAQFLVYSGCKIVVCAHYCYYSKQRQPKGTGHPVDATTSSKLHINLRYFHKHILSMTAFFFFLVSLSPCSLDCYHLTTAGESLPD